MREILHEKFVYIYKYIIIIIIYIYIYVYMCECISVCVNVAFIVDVSVQSGEHIHSDVNVCQRETTKARGGHINSAKLQLQFLC